MRISVLIVSYRRPQLLANCLRALDLQTRLPDQVVVVGVEGDHDTRDLVATFAEISVFPCAWHSVPQPSVLYQTNRGLEACNGDIVAFTNDDAEPFPDWLARIEPYYGDMTIGGVGGRDIIHLGDSHKLNERARRIGVITWFGRLHGNHHLSYPEPVEVDVLKGVNMSCRRHLLGPIDTRMVPFGPTHHWELDTCWQIRSKGRRLVY